MALIIAVQDGENGGGVQKDGQSRKASSR
jgi:hypothetical protein